MKWVVFAAALAVTVPFGLWLRKTPRHVPFVWSLAGLLVFIQGMVTFTKIGLVSWPGLPLTTHGLEVTLLDLVLLALWLAQPPGRRSAPLRVARLGYLLAVVLSMTQADYPIAVLFVAWQLLRMYFAFSVAVHACQDSRVPAAVLRGMSLGVLFTGALSLGQRYLGGFHETTGPFEHQNLVGMMCNFAVIPSFALALAGRTGRLLKITPLAGVVAVILSLSRGGIVLLLGGLGVTVLFSLRQFTGRKLAIAAVGLLVVGVLLAKGSDQLEVRFTQRSYGAFDTTVDLLDERVRLELASRLMLRGHPLGVGANHYSLALHTGGYFDQAGLVSHGAVNVEGVATEGIKVHNLYWLTAAELGSVGLAAYLFLLLSLLTTVFWNAWRARRHMRGDVLFALGIAMVLFMVQGLVEWVQLRSVAQYAFWLTSGVALGLIRSTPRRPAGPAPAGAPPGSQHAHRRP